MERRLEMIHLQLTRQCNLNCWFCGQRKNSALRNGKESMALKTEEWIRIVNELECGCRKEALGHALGRGTAHEPVL